MNISIKRKKWGNRNIVRWLPLAEIRISGCHHYLTVSSTANSKWSPLCWSLSYSCANIVELSWEDNSIETFCLCRGEVELWPMMVAAVDVGDCWNGIDADKDGSKKSKSDRSNYTIGYIIVYLFIACIFLANDKMHGQHIPLQSNEVILSNVNEDKLNCLKWSSDQNNKKIKEKRRVLSQDN